MDKSTIDARIASLCNQLKASEQQAQDLQTYVLGELAYILSYAGDREDIAECIAEIKEDVFADESDHWEIIDRWQKHFMGISESDDDSGDGDNDADDADSSDYDRD